MAPRPEGLKRRSPWWTTRPRRGAMKRGNRGGLCHRADMAAAADVISAPIGSWRRAMPLAARAAPGCRCGAPAAAGACQAAAESSFSSSGFARRSSARPRRQRCRRLRWLKMASRSHRTAAAKGLKVNEGFAFELTASNKAQTRVPASRNEWLSAASNSRMKVSLKAARTAPGSMSVRRRRRWRRCSSQKA